MAYDHQGIEKKWQKFWLENKTFKAEVDTSKPKYYVLDMFPYPSGAGLHVGHVEGYTATDILARHKRQLGFNVLHPMGWDSFGLPAEQYAMRTGTHPAETTKININNYRRQLQAMGFSYDWDREIATSDSKYYKWTQWIFTKLYEKGLAYEAEMMVNFCPELGTVLSNEEVSDGKSIEGGYPVKRRPLRQWVLKITEYADRLLQDLDLLDWPEGLKKLQQNWIGRSRGATVSFAVPSVSESISVFTTRPDTLFGASFMVLSPEHPLVAKITTPEQAAAVKGYQDEALRKSDMERTELAKDKSGVFTGGFALNPVNGKEIPIWIADYVLMGYGTGAVMAVPSGDERDFEFAKQFGLDVPAVYEPLAEIDPSDIPESYDAESLRAAVRAGEYCWSGDGQCINSENDEISLNGLSVKDAKTKVLRWLEEKGSGKESISYKLRDWLFSRQRYWGEPFPILHFEDGTKRLLELDELPLCPPEVNDYKPSGDGRSPLAKVDEWVEVQDSKTGRVARRETNTMPQWAGSCWYYLRFCDPLNEIEAWDKDVEKYWMPVDMYVGGVEHAVLHLLYARFWHKVLFDCGLVSTPEPFKTLRNQGLIVSRSFRKEEGGYVDPAKVLEKDGGYFDRDSGKELISQVEKMSKSKLNGVTPDDVVIEFGADSLRLYEMFMGPLEKEKIWNTDAVQGCHRFLKRFYEMCSSDKRCDVETEEALKLGHRLVHGVGKDIDGLQFNTAIAKMMEFVNQFTKLDKYPRSVLSMAVQALAPFAPHVAEELWEGLGNTGTVAYVPFPEVNEVYLQDAVVTYVVQVNGKLRGRFDLPKDAAEATILELAQQDERVSKHIDDKAIVKVIFIPNKLLNVVVR